MTTYEYKIVRIGGDPDLINDSLEPYTKEGYKIHTVIDQMFLTGTRSETTYTFLLERLCRDRNEL